jgi:hypothetical protein
MSNAAMHLGHITDDVLWRATRRADNRQIKREYHSRRGPVHSNGWLCSSRPPAMPVGPKPEDGHAAKDDADHLERTHLFEITDTQQWAHVERGTIRRVNERLQKCEHDHCGHHPQGSPCAPEPRWDAQPVRRCGGRRLVVDVLLHNYYSRALRSR